VYSTFPLLLLQTKKAHRPFAVRSVGSQQLSELNDLQILLPESFAIRPASSDHLPLRRPVLVGALFADHYAIVSISWKVR
jgi:hypothetical protein